MKQRTGRVRGVRVTDLAAVGDLSRLSHTLDEAPERVRSLGLPVSASQISVFSLFRMPLGAFLPQDMLYVYEDDGRIAGLLRCERDSHRDEWTIVELDAVDHGIAGDIRLRLVQYLLREGGKRGAGRFHVACADAGGNVEVFMQAGFVRYGEETILYRPPGEPPPPLLAEPQASAIGIRPTAPLDALALDRLYRTTTPMPVARLERYSLPDWERQGTQWRIPRSALTPVLRFTDVEAFVQECPGPRGTELAAFVQVGVAKEDHPHYLRVIARPDYDPSALIDYGLAVIADRSAAGGGWPVLGGGHRHDHGVVSPVRTYESPVDRRLEESGFASIATVTLLMKETLVRVAEPALVPAIQ